MKFYLGSALSALFFVLLHVCVVEPAFGQVRGKTMEARELTEDEDVVLEVQSDLQDIINGLAVGDITVEGEESVRLLTHLSNPFLNVTYAESCGDSPNFIKYLKCITNLCREIFPDIRRTSRRCVVYGLWLPLIGAI